MADNNIARFADMLGQAQWLAPERLASLQVTLLDRLVRHAAAETGAYGTRLRPVLADDGQIDWTRWEEIPVLTRQEIQGAQGEYVARSTPPAAGRIVQRSTSGSTGRSMLFPVNSALVDVSGAAVERLHDWTGIDRDATYACISVSSGPRSFPVEGEIRDRWSWKGGAGRFAVMSIEATVEAQLDFLDQIQPAYVRTYPTNAAALAKLGRGRPWARSLRRFFVVGEPLTDDHIDTIKANVGVNVSAFYGSEEAGHIAAQCPHSGDYHIGSELIHVELLREDGSPCESGEEGRVVVTPFYAYAMPLVRYDQGDLAVLSERPCGCGRSLPTIRRILGRSRDMFVTPDGKRIWPRLSETQMLEFVPAVQRQVVQHSTQRVELRYVHDGSEREVDLGGLRELFKRRYWPSLEVEVTRCDALVRSPGGKYREFICLIDQ